MKDSVQTLSYLVAGVLFVLSLRGLSTQESARRGNLLGIVGMLLAVLITAAGLLLPGPGVQQAPAGLALVLGALVVGALIGQGLAARVAMTAMPELVAILHSFVGAAAVLVGIGSFLKEQDSAVGVAHSVEVFIGVLIGALTFTGSVVAFLKLRGSLRSKPLLLPGRHGLNAGILLGSVALTVWGLSRTTGPGARLGGRWRCWRSFW